MPALSLIFFLFHSLSYFLFIFTLYCSLPFSEHYLLHLASRDLSFFLVCYYSCLSQGRVRFSRVGLSAAVTPSPYGLLFHHDTHIASNHINLLPSANLAKYQQNSVVCLHHPNTIITFNAPRHHSSNHPTQH